MNNKTNGASPEHRRDQLKHLLQEAAEKSQPSIAQTRVWFLHELESGRDVYVIQAAIQICGTVDEDILERALGEIVARHESLRTQFVDRGGEPAQLVVPHMPVCLERADLSPVPADRREVAIHGHLVEEAERPFDLAEGPLMRARLLRLGADDHVLLLTLHHIVADDWSMGVFVEEMAALYGAFARGEASPLAQLPVQYADFAAWQREQLRGERLDEQLGYWREQLGDGLAALDLPADRPRPPVQTYRGAEVQITLAAGCARQLRELGGSQDATLFMTLLAGLAALLARYTGQDDLAVGTFIANRPRPELERLIGFFVNTLALRIDLAGDPTFAELLTRARGACLGAYAHQDIPFEKLLEELRPERDLSRTPFFQVMLVVHNAPLPPLELPGTSMTLLPLPARRAHFDLTVHVEERDNGDLSVRFEYNTDLFDQATIAQLAGHYSRLLQAAATDPGQRVSQLPLLTDEEQHRLLVEWNDTASDVPIDTCIHQLFEQQAERSPDAVAVIGATDRLTYRQLNQRANQLARYLREHGAGPDIPVGICLERAPEAITAILAVLKSGSAYLPLDPHHPPERLAHMLRDAGARLLITNRTQPRQLPQHTGTTIYLDTTWPETSHYDDSNLPSHNTPSDLAYIIYTSGSTGTPKGVLGLHRGIVNVVRWLHSTYPAGNGDVAVQRTSLAFVDATWEIFAPLLAGVPLVIASDDVVRDPERYVGLLEHHAVTRMVIVPSLLRVLLHGDLEIETRLAGLRHCFSSGEPLTGDLVQTFRKRLPDAQLVNVYGTSEVSADATFYDLNENALAVRIPIGRPIANANVYVLDSRLHPVPIGVTGEICVGGAGVARGYLGREDLTSEKFVVSPFAGSPAARLYRTGDLGRYRRDGNLEYVGRADEQVKIRGFRVEPGEIEARLAEHASVREASVVAETGTSAEKRLIAYVVPEPGQAPPTVPDLRQFLKDKLPEFMIPSAFLLIDELPRTATGKIDRPSLAGAVAAPPSADRPFVGPRTPTERALCEIFTELLGVERVSVDDDFFELGGHSLLVIQLLAKLRDRFQMDLPMIVLYEVSTISGLADTVESIRHSGIQSAPTALNSPSRFEVDCALDEEIQPSEAMPYSYSKEPTNVFMTGATGFLGVHLLYELMQQSDATVFCLVRASSAERAKLRIREKMDAASRWDPRFGARIVPVLGELTKPMFGMSREAYDELAQTIEHVYHSGAYVNFVFPYSALRATNVGGTREAIRLASHIRLKPLHHISLTDVALRRRDDGVWYIDEEPALEYPRGIFMSGYAQSKWVAERLVTVAQERGLPVTIYRPGFIEGNSETGFCNPASELCLTLKACVDLGTAPDHDMMFDAAPVDYASKAIIYLSRQPESVGQIFNAVNVHPAHVRQVIDWISESGHPLKRIPYPEWRDQVIKEVAPDPTHPFYPLLPYALDFDIARMPLAFPCDCSNTLNGLTGSGISCPPVEPALLGTCLKYLERVGFLPPPKENAMRSGLMPIS